MNAYEIIRNTLDIEDVACRYGVEVKHRKASCPFHSDRTPSMGFKNGRFKCFGCGESGDAVDLVAKLYGTSLREAAARLNADYNLRLTFESPISTNEVNAAKRRQTLKAAWAERALEISSAMRRYVDIRRMKEGWVESTAQYVIDEWTYSDDDKRMELYADWKGEIEKIERYVRANRG